METKMMKIKRQLIEWLKKAKGLAAFYPSLAAKMFDCTEAEAMAALMELTDIVEPVYEILCPECLRTIQEITEPVAPSDDWVECICGHEFDPSEYDTSLKFKIKRKAA